MHASPTGFGLPLSTYETKLRRLLGGMSIFTLLMTMLSSETPDFGTKIVKYDNLAWSDPEPLLK